jgi:hypothetical protein
MMTSVTVLAMVLIPQVRSLLFQQPADLAQFCFWYVLLVLAWVVGLGFVKLVVAADRVASASVIRVPFVGLLQTRTALTLFFGFTVFGFLVGTLQTLFRGSSGWLGWLPVPLTVALPAVGAWFLPIRVPLEKWLARLRYGRNIWIRAVIAYAALFFFGECLWWLAVHDYASFRGYTIWGLIQVLLFLIILARVVESIRLVTVRVVILAGAGTLGLVVQSWSVGRPDAAPPAGETQGSVFLRSLFDKVQGLPKGEPVVMVAASGGGSRAALFTALVLESLERLKVGDRSVGERICLISAVSGGSLGSAYFAVQCAGGGEGVLERVATGEARHSIHVDVEDRLRSFAGQEASSAGADPQTAALLGKIADRSKGPPRWMFESEFVDSMNTDFMAPLIRAVLWPFLDRSRSLRGLWEDEFGWHDQGNRQPLPASEGRLPPVLLLNATDADLGTRLVVGYPALPQDLLGGEQGRARSLRSLDPDLALSLAEGVGLSANFPWGIPVANLATQNEAGATVTVVDGGVFDNTGIDTVHDFLQALREAPSGPNPDPFAERLWEELCQRGVLLIEIDSGAKPKEMGALQRFYKEIFQPAHSLKKSSHVRAVQAKADYLKRIEELLTPERNPQDVRFDHVTYLCNDDKNVMTAWALSTDDKAWIKLRYLIEKEPSERWIEDYLEECTEIARARKEPHARKPDFRSMNALRNRLNLEQNSRAQMFDKKPPPK